MTARTVLLLLLLLAATPCTAETAGVRIRGSRYVGGVEERISCDASANRWHRDGSGLRRFELAASCPLAADLTGIVFAGREDAIVAYGVPTRRAIVVATVAGALGGTVTAETRRYADGTFTYERGRLAYHMGSVIFTGDYKVRCDLTSDVCSP